MNTFSYHLPTKVIFGWEAVNNLPAIIKKHFPNKSRILLVTGTLALKKTGITDRILKLLSEFTVVLFDKVEPNPSSDAVHEGIELYKRSKCDLIIGVGGGSVIDTGKAIALLNNNKDSLENYQSGKVSPTNPSEDYIAISTTSGTSSEMTMWSVITNLEGVYKNTKKSIGHPFVYPKLAIIDPQLTVSLSPYQTASTGLDALSQAIEGCLSKKRNSLSTVYLLPAVKLIIKYLPVAYKDGENQEAREQMSFATFLTGLGFSNSRTMSPHKASYPITTHYNLPHGAACTLTLPYFMEYIGDHKPELLDDVVEALGCRDYKEACEFLKQFIKDLNMPTTLGELGVTKEGVMFIAKDSYVPVDKQEDPVPIEYEDYVEIIEKAL